MRRIEADRLELVLLTPEIMEALVEGRHADAEQLTRIAIPREWPDEHDARFLRFRLKQVGEDVEQEPFLARAIARREDGTMVGHIGFHGKPGINAPKRAGAVEIGYTVFEPYRRRGYAEEAIRVLLRWAQDEHGVRTFIASVSPDNEPSLALLRKLGFVEIGRHWDDVDGEELEFELNLG